MAAALLPQAWSEQVDTGEGHSWQCLLDNGMSDS
jgi:hypothetical protein